MDTSRRDDVRELLAAAQSVPSEERADFLQDRCDDPALRAEVASLLAAQEEASGFYEALADSVVAPMLRDLGVENVGAPHREGSDLVAREGERKDVEGGASRSPVETGTQVGRYRLLEEIGVGGMSVVYRAERADGAFEQTVAVKLLQRRLCTDDVQTRVRAERQVLASLDHPNIARLIDGGVTEGDRPYLAMEYVDGVPLTEYADTHDLDVDARLDLLMQVVDAVQAAHRRLVVHRDLKPSNVLVTETEDRPQVKLLDFGIAKLLGDTLPVTRPQTQTGHHFLTPAYAAPEQVTGGDVTTATDVYQLGVLAYELLVGTRPFNLSDRSLAEIERVICEKSPEQPSRQAAAEAGQLRGDLDTMILKALRKEPERRYQSVEALGNDLRRYRSGKPITARAATLGYRVRKFVDRHRGGVAASAAVAIILAMSVGLLLHQKAATERQRARAQTEAETAQQVSDFMVNLFEASSPYEAPDTVTARTLLRRGQQRIGDLEVQPAVRARLLGAMGEAHSELGNYDRADSLLQRALALYRGDAVDAPSHRADALSALGNLRAGEYEYDNAVSRYQTARSLLREAAPPDSRSDTLLMAGVLEGLGQAFRNVGKLDSAETLVRRALRVYRHTLGPDDETTWDAKGTLAYVLRESGSLDESEQLYRKVLAAEREHGDSLGVAWTLNNLGYLQGKQGEFAVQERRYRQALRIWEVKLGPAHPQALVARGNNLSVSHRLQDDYRAAVRVLREQLRAVRAHYPPDHWRVGKWAGALGELLLDGGRRLNEAERLLREQLRIYRALDYSDVTIAEAKAPLARCLAAQGADQQAFPLLTNSNAVLMADSARQGTPLDRVDVKVGLGLYHMRQGHYAQAETLLTTARDTLASVWERLGTDATLPSVRRVEHHLDRLYATWTRPD
jgi:serine/threonine-protein kinase